MLKAIIFDMDGLMIDSERLCFDGFVQEFEKNGYEMTRELYQLVLGRNTPSIYRSFKDKFGEDFPIEVMHKGALEYVDTYFKEEGVPLKKGLKELLAYAHENKYKTIVATSSNRKRVDFILKRAGLAEHFDDSICGDEVTNGKPNPEVFLKACDKLGVSIDEVIVLEDSEMGIKAAADGNMRVICIPDMKFPEEEYALRTEQIMPSLKHVISVLEKEEKEWPENLF